MPKLKTKRAAAKRFRITRRGKIIHQHACRSHLLRKKRPARKRRLRLPGLLAPGDRKRVFHMLPNAH